jgi:asparagine synthase (glutamine-hydrolysing)
MGFGVPIGEWFRGELRTTLNDALFDSQSLCRQLFRPDWLRSLVDAHLSGRDELGHPLWTLLMLEIWQRRWNACLA